MNLWLLAAFVAAFIAGGLAATVVLCVWSSDKEPRK